MHGAPSVPPSRSARPTPPRELVRRLLERFGDRSVVQAITLGSPPPHRRLRHVFPGQRPPPDALWAYISAPKAVEITSRRPTAEEVAASTLARWQTTLVGGALRDDFCRAGAKSLVGWSIAGQPGGGVSDGTFALNQRFPNPSRHEFRQRVALVGKRYGFRATSIRFLRPRELAPIVVVETDRDRKKFVADVAAIMNLLDPRSTSGKQSAVTFEGFFFEARDADGLFVLVDNAYRGEIMGGEWSADPDSYPYPHG
jgi:hypothetical protein